jgi:hypothetical protein
MTGVSVADFSSSTNRSTTQKEKESGPLCSCGEGRQKFARQPAKCAVGHDYDNIASATPGSHKLTDLINTLSGVRRFVDCP